MKPISTARLFVKNDGGGYRNTTLNWHSEPTLEFHLYAEAFWEAGKKLLENELLERVPIAQFDATVIVYLYRHALELFMKEILMGRGAELISPRPSPESVTKAGHSLTALLPQIREIFKVVEWDKNFGSSAVATFDDFAAIVEEFEKADPYSSSFRYPVKKDLSAALGGPFEFSIRKFAEVMDEIFETLDGACTGLHEIADAEAEARAEAANYKNGYFD